MTLMEKWAALQALESVKSKLEEMADLPIEAIAAIDAEIERWQSRASK